MSHAITPDDITATTRIARGFLASRNVPYQERDDYVQTALVGLAEAAATFVEGGAPFMAYAHRRATGAILDKMREGDTLTRAARHADKEAAQRGAPRDPAGAPAVLLSAFPTGIPQGARLAIRPSTTDRSGLASNVLWKRVRNVFPRLRPEERRVLTLTFGQSLTLKEAGAVLGLSESGVCRLRARALARVRDLTAATIAGATE